MLFDRILEILVAAFIDISDIVNFLKNRIILLTCDYIYLTYRMISTQERKKRFSLVRESSSFQIRNKLKNCRVCNTYIFVARGILRGYCSLFFFSFRIVVKMPSQKYLPCQSRGRGGGSSINVVD